MLNEIFPTHSSEFEIEGFRGRSSNGQEGYYLMFPGGDLIFTDKSRIVHPLLGEIAPQTGGDNAFQMVLKSLSSYEDVDAVLPNAPREFKRALTTYLEEKRRRVHWAELTYRFLYAKRRDNSFGEPITSDGECEVYTFTADKSDIRHLLN
ncbi:MAG: hypothetical protein ABIH49_02155 [archaeon]